MHEGPQGIGVRIAYNDTPLKPGMVISNGLSSLFVQECLVDYLTEPGYYEDGKFGIRIENIVIVQPAKPPNNFGGKEYYKFEHVTMVSLENSMHGNKCSTKEKCPMHRKLVDIDLITVREKEWLNSYHKEVFQKVSPLLKEDPFALEWLSRECEPL